MSKQSDKKKIGTSSGLFVIDAAKLPIEPFVLKQEIPLGWLSEELRGCEYDVVPYKADMNLSIEPTGNGFLVQGQIHVQAMTKCAVCLSEAQFDLNPSISAFWMRKPTADKILDDPDLTLEDLETEWFEGDMMVLDGLVRDEIMLALPMNPKCSDICPGLAEYAPRQSEPALDPRLSPLANFLSEKEK